MLPFHVKLALSLVRGTKLPQLIIQFCVNDSCSIVSSVLSALCFILTSQLDMFFFSFNLRRKRRRDQIDGITFLKDKLKQRHPNQMKNHLKKK